MSQIATDLKHLDAESLPVKGWEFRGFEQGWLDDYMVHENADGTIAAICFNEFYGYCIKLADRNMIVFDSEWGWTLEEVMSYSRFFN